MRSPRPERAMPTSVATWSAEPRRMRMPGRRCRPPRRSRSSTGWCERSW
jgi:hypothetical protein